MSNLLLPKLRGYQRPQSRRRGQALIEFALIAIVFLTLLLGMLQFGIYQSTANGLWNLSREGARFASVSTPSDADIRAHVLAVAPPNIKASNMTIDVYPATRKSGDSVAVCITYNMQDKIIFPLVGKFLSRVRDIPANDPIPPVHLTGYNYFTSSTMRVE